MTAAIPAVDGAGAGLTVRARALWDALAKAAGLPLARLLGGTLEPVPAYNSNGLGLIPPAAAGDCRGTCCASRRRLRRRSLSRDRP
jgi:hypothetical protein